MYIATGSYHTVLVSEDGQHIWTFGYNSFGQLGHGDNEDKNVPTEIQRRKNALPEDVKIIGAKCGAFHTVLISDDGRIWTFGHNEYGQLGHGDMENRNIPTEIHRGLNGIPEDVKIVDASCGEYHTVLLSDDGRIWTFGNNACGQLGLGYSGYDTGRIIPTKIPIGENGLHKDVNIVKVSCGNYHTVLLSDDGGIWTFGSNVRGQLGHGDNFNRNVPTIIQREELGLPEGVRIIDVSCDACLTVLLSDDGRVWTFGINTNGQLGHGDMENKNVPTEIQRGLNGLPEDVNIVKVSCGEYHTVLLSDDGRIWTFGDNYHCQLGLGYSGYDTGRNIPTEIQIIKNEFPEDVKIVDVSCGNSHTVLLSDNGRIWTFGDNHCGQLGLGNTNNKFVPTEIQDFSLRDLGSLTKSANKT